MIRLLAFCFFLCISFRVQAEEKLNVDQVAKWLEQPILKPETTFHEAQDYCRTKVRPWTEVTSIAEWEKVREQMRTDVLQQVVFRGEAAKWKDAQLGVEFLETIDGGPGYTIQKLRYEAVPGMWIPALLYVPVKLANKVPVALHVNGHDPKGKAADYKQLRCIHLAKQGMIVLNTEWLGMGQLALPDFSHYKLNQLDLCGTSGLAPFYLAMSRALDVLLAHPHADPNRVAVAGLSGGGWQTIIISSLDERVTLANPVAGYSSFLTRIDVSADLGDSEQAPVDLGKYADYFHLTAMRAPKPTLLTYNAKDNCCFVAKTTLPPLLEVAGPLFRLYGRPEALRSHVNDEPGDHNFGLENRLAYYQMVGDHFFANQSFDAQESAEWNQEVKTAEQLQIPLPEQNADFHSLAMSVMTSLPRHAEIPTEEPQRTQWRKNLVHQLKSDILRWPNDAMTIDLGTTELVNDITITRRIMRFGGYWSVPIVEFTRGTPERTTVFLADAGRKSLAEQVVQGLMERPAGGRVVAFDPFYFGECALGKQDALYALLLSSIGDRALGLEAAQIAAVVKWSCDTFPDQPVQVKAHGRRTSLAALCAAVVTSEDNQANRVERYVYEQGMQSLKDVITENLGVNKAPDLFTFGLLEFVDIPQLLAATGKPIAP